jgi:hypothetical protein
MEPRIRSNTTVSDVSNSTNSPTRKRSYSQNTTSQQSNSEQELSSPLRNTRFETLDSSGYSPIRFNSSHLTGMEINTASSSYTAMRAREGSIAAVKNSIVLQAQQRARRQSNLKELSLVVEVQHSAGKASPTHMEGMRRRSSVLNSMTGGRYGKRRPSSAIDLGLGRRQSVKIGHDVGGVGGGAEMGAAGGSRRPSTAGPAAGSRRLSTGGTGERKMSLGSKASVRRPSTAEGGGRPQSWVKKSNEKRPQSAKKAAKRRMGPRTNAHKEKALVDYHAGSAVQLLRKQKSERAREGLI